jgi:hypothetical protein
MSLALQLRRGNTANSTAFTGANGELTFDFQRKQLTVHDGATAGGAKLVATGSLVSGSIALDASFGIAIYAVAGSTYDFGLRSAAGVNVAVIPTGTSNLHVLTNLVLSNPLGTASGGLGVVLAAPGADRILFWDHSALAYAYLTAGSGLTITGTTITSSGGAGTPGGSNTHVQFNDSTTFGGQSGFVFDKTTNALTLTGDIKGRHLLGGTSTPTIASGFGTSPSIAGKDSAFRVTIGTSPGSTGVVTFGTAFATAPCVVVNNESSGNYLRATSNTTACVISGLFAASDVLTAIVVGY